MSMEHSWNDNEKGKLKYINKNLFHCHFVHHKSHTDWPGTEPRPPWYMKSEILTFLHILMNTSKFLTLLHAILHPQSIIKVHKIKTSLVNSIKDNMQKQMYT
jgi:hypothetical protein